MNFQQTVDYLLSLGNEVETMKLGLENIRKLLDALGGPQKHYVKVQIAGTNGKGSVCAFLGSICREAGIRTGVYTSPHLVSITERVNIDGVDISEDDFARLATRVRDVSEKLVAEGAIETVPTYFEQVTAIALLGFAESKMEIAILETGLGGRYDAVTAANAEICAITRIDLDHQEFLGDTIEEIAAEKAAIIRADSRVVIGEQFDAAFDVILNQCRRLGVAPTLLNGGRTTGRCAANVYEEEAHSLPLVFPPLGLAGIHQIENAEVTVAIVEMLRGYFPITNEQISDGLAKARHPGRLERIDRFLLDAAHNPAGAKALRYYLDEFVDQPITLIFGAMKDKNVEEIAEILFPKAEHVVLTEPSNTRAMPVEEVADLVPTSFDQGRLFKYPDVADALSKAEAVTPENGIILVTGSLYLVGDIKRILKSRI